MAKIDSLRTKLIELDGKEKLAKSLVLNKKSHESCKKCGEPHTIEKRCWEGYKPTPGKKPYSDGSCTKKSESASKSLIPVHDHRPASRTGSGVEDVPYGQVNPKGVDKKEKTMKSEKCAKCGEMHQDIKKCGVVKSEPTKTPSEWKGAKVELPGSKIKKFIWPADNPMAMSETKKAMSAGNKSGAPSTVVDQLGKAVPVAKPPSGVNMAKVPTSAPKPAMAKGLTNMTSAARSSERAPTAGSMAKSEDVKKGIMSDAARNSDPMVASHAAHVASQKPAPAPKKMPTPEQHASRAAEFDAALGGQYQPTPSPAAKPQGLKSPKAAGVVASKPVMNAARPAKPGIFATLSAAFSKK
jgi:hypothetical protein